MKTLLIPLLLLTLTSCGSFGAGLRDGFEASLRDNVVAGVSNVVADRLNAHAEKLSGISAESTKILAEAVRELPGLIPKPVPPPEPKDNTVGYGIAFLLAKLVGDGVGALGRRAVSKGAA